MTTPDDLLPIAQAAMDIARARLLDHRPETVTAKGDRDFASDLDYAIERELRTFLREQTPRIGFLGEEEGSEQLEEDQPFWALDPVDGTSNLIHGLPMCGTSLGLIHRDRPILGVVEFPFLNERYHAVQRQGAYLNDRLVHAASTTTLNAAIVALGDYAVGPGAGPKNRKRLAITNLLGQRAERIRMLGSAAIDLVWTASGRLDGAILLSNKPWDTAAGVVIAREAGVHVVDVDGKPHDLHSTTTVAAAPGILDELLALLADPTVNAP
ncbi:inositol monophosphatase family protein [Actinopolymorpha pittospori]